MVYSGKPSSGCARCKERRKKCDETKPACINCQKLGCPCPGFPDQLDLMFKNETARVTGRATGTSKRRRSCKNRGVAENSKEFKTATSSSASSIDGRQQSNKGTVPLDEPNELIFVPKAEVQDVMDDTSWLDDLNPFAGVIFNPSMERQATSFFFENFIAPTRSREASRGFLKILIPMYEATPANSPLSIATEALAVRTAANFTGDKHLLPHAEQLYGQALKSIQLAIQEQTQATSNETLLSILLFSLYESVTTSDVDNWSKHIKGAVSIVKSRGTTQFGDPESLLLFRATRTQMLMDAISRGEALEEFPGPAGWLSDQKDGTGSCIIEHSIRLPNILANAKRLLILDQDLESIAEVNDLLHEAYNLQHELFDWELNMPTEFGYKSVYHTDTDRKAEAEFNIIRSKVWRPGLVHIYNDVQTASIRNNNRVSQLLCSTVVIDSLKWLDPEGFVEDRRYKAAAYRVKYLVDDIAASVPFHLGYSVAEDDPLPKKGSRKYGINSTGGYFLIWPLLICSSMPEVPALQRKWLRGKLQLIARQFGLGPADIPRARPGGVWSGDVYDSINSDRKEITARS